MTRMNTMMASILALVVAAGAVQAHDQGSRREGPKMPEFSTLDTNSDGRITPQEMQAHRDAKQAERFKAMDTDGDGKISLDEFKAGFAAKAPEDRR